MAAAAPVNQAQFIYSPCHLCGPFLNGPNVQINTGGLNSRVTMKVPVLFPFSAEGYIHSENGLEITSASKKVYTICNSGTFYITITEKQEPKIVCIEHACSHAPKVPPLIEDPLDSLDLSLLEKYVLSTQVEEVELPDEKEAEAMYVGFAVLSPDNNKFTYEAKTAKNLNTSESATSFDLPDGRKIQIQVLQEGIFINGILSASEEGKYSIHILPGENKFHCIKMLSV